MITGVVSFYVSFIFVKNIYISQGGKVIYFIKEGISFKLVKNTKIIIFLIMAMIVFILSVLFIGVEKFFSFLGMFFVIALLLGAVAINNKKITFDSEKNKVSVNIRKEMFTKKTNWAQTLIEEISDIMEVSTNKIKLDSIETK